jgi:hypothetical protein
VTRTDTVVRVYLPPAKEVTAIDRSGRVLAALTAAVHPGAVRRQNSEAARLSAAHSLARWRRAGDRRPVFLRPVTGRTRHLSAGRRQPSGTGSLPGRPGDERRWRVRACVSPSGHPMRSASRSSATSIRGTGVTRCANGWRRASGSCSFRVCHRHDLQIRDSRTAWPAAAQGRSGGAAGRNTAAYRLGRGRSDAVSMERCGWLRSRASNQRAAARADVDL